MFTVHGDDDGIPDLRDENLRLILDFHIGGGEKLGVDTFWKTLEYIRPRSPDRKTHLERPTDTEDSVPDDVPLLEMERERIKRSEKSRRSKADGEAENLACQLTKKVSKKKRTRSMIDMAAKAKAG